MKCVENNFCFPNRKLLQIHRLPAPQWSSTAGVSSSLSKISLNSLSAALKLCLLKLCSVSIIYTTWSKIKRGYDILADSLDLKWVFLTLCRRL